MVKRLTQTEAEAKLKRYNFELCSEYCGAHHPCDIKCRCGNIFNCQPGNIFTGSRVKCDLCRPKHVLTQDEAWEYVENLNLGFHLVKESFKHDTHQSDFVCNCGFKFSRSLKSIKHTVRMNSAITRSCGCHMSSLRGQEFGDLTVISDYKILINQSYYEQCLCSCGTKVNVRRTKLLHNRQHCCGPKHLINVIDREIQDYFDKFGLIRLNQYICNTLPIKGICTCGNNFVVGRPALLRYIKNDKIYKCSDCSLKFKKKVNSIIGDFQILPDHYGKRIIFWHRKCVRCGHTDWKKPSCIISNSRCEICAHVFNKVAVGNKFGKLTVLNTKNYKLTGGHYCVKCKCDCGKQKYVSIAKMRRGNNLSCGNCDSFIRGAKTSITAQKFHSVVGRGVHNYRTKCGCCVDIALVYCGKRIIVEYDENFWHKDKKVRDLRKTKKLLDNGWYVLRVLASGDIPDKKTIWAAINRLIKKDNRLLILKSKKWKGYE